MSFPNKVSEDALVKCGRCCCICHRFCGIKIELHHIKQKADGGDDSFENCIPLCLNCHADVKAYNPHHPKGRKYTESELKKHRDEWYKKRTETTAFQYTDEHRQIDQRIFKELYELLNCNSFIYFVETHNFSYPFKEESIEPLDKFLFYWKEPEYEFTDTEIESVRAELYILLKKFSILLSQNTFPNGNDELSVPDEWSWEYEDRYNKTISDLDSIANQIYETYCKIIKIGREKLSLRYPKY